MVPLPPHRRCCEPNRRAHHPAVDLAAADHHYHPTAPSQQAFNRAQIARPCRHLNLPRAPTIEIALDKGIKLSSSYQILCAKKGFKLPQSSLAVRRYGARGAVAVFVSLVV